MPMIIVGRWLGNFFWELISFPLWWYSVGLWWWGGKIGQAARAEWRRLAVGLWIKNIFVPMYGQNDFWGRLISVGMRLIQIGGRAAAWLIWLVILLCGLVAWFAIPVICVYWLLSGLTRTSL